MNKLLKSILLLTMTTQVATAYGEDENRKINPDKGDPSKGIMPVPQNPMQEAGQPTSIMPNPPKDYRPQRKENYKLRIDTFPLDDQNVYEIPVRYDDGVTTFMFPSRITGIDAANVTRQPLRDSQSKELLGDFLISYTAGSHYFSIVALKKGAKGSLNIKYNKKTYVIRIYQDDTKDPFATVTFTEETEAPNGIPGYTNTNRKRISPNAIAGCMDIAKGYHLFKKYHPQRLKDVACMKMNIINYYKKFNVKVEEAFRFDREDTIVFRIIMENLTDKELSYEPDTLSVRLGNIIYYASMADASGKVPPRSMVPAYFAITGTPTGGRNNLKLENKWNIIVSTKDMEYNPYTQIKDDTDDKRRKELEETAFQLANKINALPLLKTQMERDTVSAEIKELSEKIQKLRQPEIRTPDSILQAQPVPAPVKNRYSSLTPEDKKREFENTVLKIINTINKMPAIKTKTEQDNATEEIVNSIEKLRELKESGSHASPEFEKATYQFIAELNRLPKIKSKDEQETAAINTNNLAIQIQQIKEKEDAAKQISTPEIKTEELPKAQSIKTDDSFWNIFWPFGDSETEEPGKAEQL